MASLTEIYALLAIGIVALVIGFLLRSKGKSIGLALALVGVLFLVSPAVSLALDAFGGASKVGLGTNVVGAVIIIAGLAAGAYAVKRRRTMKL